MNWTYKCAAVDDHSFTAVAVEQVIPIMRKQHKEYLLWFTNQNYHNYTELHVCKYMLIDKKT